MYQFSMYWSRPSTTSYFTDSAMQTNFNRHITFMAYSRSRSTTASPFAGTASVNCWTPEDRGRFSCSSESFPQTTSLAASSASSSAGVGYCGSPSSLNLAFGLVCVSSIRARVACAKAVLETLAGSWTVMLHIMPAVADIVGWLYRKSRKAVALRVASSPPAVLLSLSVQRVAICATAGASFPRVCLVIGAQSHVC